MQNLASANKKQFGISFIFLLCIFAIAFWCYKKPAYNWDMLPYMAIVKHTETNNIDSIHAFVYSTAKIEITAPAYALLTDSSNNYRKTMAINSTEFFKQLPYYYIKPLYIVFVYAFYKIGFPLTKATELPSIISFLFISILFYFWLKKYVPATIAFAIALMLMLSSPILMSLRSSTPDFLSAAFLFAALYFIAEKNKPWLTLLFFSLAIFTRLDNIIAAFFFFTLLTICQIPGRQISKKKFILFTTLCSVACLATIFIASKFGWGSNYYPVISYNTWHGTKPFSLQEYFTAFYENTANGLIYTHIFLFAVIAIYVLIPSWPLKFKSLQFHQLLACTILLLFAARYILFPGIDDRFYIAYYLVLALLAAKTFAQTKSIAK